MDTKIIAPPTSKPSCDRYSQPPRIKPTPPCSPDDALHSHINIVAIEADFPIRKFFFVFFSLSKKTSKTIEEGGSYFPIFFFGNLPSRDFVF